MSVILIIKLFGQSVHFSAILSCFGK